MLEGAKAINKNADAMKDRIADDPFGAADPLPPTATDPELEARILRELAERDAALEG
jgi:hypothetical protein